LIIGRHRLKTYKKERKKERKKEKIFCKQTYQDWSQATLFIKRLDDDHKVMPDKKKKKLCEREDKFSQRYGQTNNAIKN